MTTPNILNPIPVHETPSTPSTATPTEMASSPSTPDSHPSGLGRQICWEAAQQFSSRFLSMNFSSKKHDLGFSLMNQLSVAEKCFPGSEADIAADYFALRKVYTGTKWIFTESCNTLNPLSHCDIAWAGALATHAHTSRPASVGAAVLMEDGTVHHSDGRITRLPGPPSRLFFDGRTHWPAKWVVGE
jgi:hypothetical protein